jgi:hypothetical protein
MHKRRAHAALVTSLCAIVSGCAATLIRGTTDEMLVSSNPPGASVQVTGSLWFTELTGSTPMAFTVGSADDVTVQIGKDGYESESVTLVPSFQWGMFVLDLPFPFFDMLTGALWHHDQKNVAVQLRPHAASAP